MLFNPFTPVYPTFIAALAVAPESGAKLMPFLLDGVPILLSLLP